MTTPPSVAQIRTGLGRCARAIAAGKAAEAEMVDLYLAGHAAKVKHKDLAAWADRKPAAVSKALSTARRRRGL